MGRTRNSGLGIGAGSSPQGSVSQCKVDEKIRELSEQESMLSKLEEAGVKFNRNDVLFVTKDKTGQMIWLEKGNPKAGLEHILNGDDKSGGHAQQFEKAFGLKPDDIPDYLNKVITNGVIVSNQLKMIGNNRGYERVYYYEGNYNIVTGIGTNGFIISAYPHRRGGK